MMFPSPTGVTYYEYITIISLICLRITSFRPQQGLPIMNKKYFENYEKKIKDYSFRPQQGLPIMNNESK